MIDLKGEWTKLLHPRYYFAATVATALVLFLPHTTLTSIGLNDFRQATRPWLGIVLIVSVTLLATHAVTALSKWGATRLKDARKKKQQFSYLQSLTDSEKAFLRPYVEQRTKTQEAQVNSGIVTGLAHKGVLYVASDTLHKNLFISPTAWYGQVNVSDWAFSYLCSNPQIVRPTHALLDASVGGANGAAILPP